MKVVVLACELERVNTYNYTLVRENEVLRVQANKSERERDLETKLAIVLAENEKLNQIIEEVYEVYMSTRGVSSNHEYEARLAEVYEDLEEWKHKYNALESSTNVVQLQNQIKELHHQRDLLTEQLARKDRDLEAMRARIAPLEGNMSNSQEFQHKVSILSAENANLKKEVDALKLKHGNADALQLRLADYDNKVRTVLAENEKLNDLLLAKANEVKELRERLAHEAHNNSRIHEYTMNVQNEAVQQKKASAAVHNDAAERLQGLLRENDELKHEVEHLKNELFAARELEAQLRVLREENSRLHAHLHEKERELHAASGHHGQSLEHQAAIERLSIKIQELLVQNENLNKLAETKGAEVSGLKARIRELESKHHANDDSNIRIHILSDENAKLKDQLEHKKHEVEDLYGRCSELSQSSLMISEYKDKLIMVTTENERLNSLLHAKLEEVEALRRKIAALETSRPDTHALEEKIHVLLSENQRLTDLTRSQASELDNLRHKIYDLQGASHQSGELSMKLALISTENERLSREVDDLKRKLRDDQTQSLQSQINYLHSEIHKLEGLLDDKDRELHNTRDNHSKALEGHTIELHRQSETLKSAGADQRRKIGELEGRISQLLGLEHKVQYLSMEVEKLHKDVIERENHIQLISQKLAEKEREVADLKLKLQAAEHQRQYESADLRSRIQVELESKFAGIRHDLEEQIHRLEDQIHRLAHEKKELEDKARYTVMENERLQALIKDLRIENDDWKNRYYQLQHSSDSEVDELRRQFEGLKAMTLQAKELQQKFSAERTAYETQILQMSQVVSDLEHQIHILQSENERVTNLSIQRLSVIEELKHNSNEDAHRLEVHELRTQLEQLKSNSYDVKQLALQYSSEKGTLQSKIGELTQLNSNYKNDINELKSLLDKRKIDVESLNKQVKNNMIIVFLIC